MKALGETGWIGVEIGELVSERVEVWEYGWLSGVVLMIIV